MVKYALGILTTEGYGEGFFITWVELEKANQERIFIGIAFVICLDSRSFQTFQTFKTSKLFILFIFEILYNL